MIYGKEVKIICTYEVKRHFRTWQRNQIKMLTQIKIEEKKNIKETINEENVDWVSQEKEISHPDQKYHDITAINLYK